MIKRLCNKALYLKNGYMQEYGESGIVCSHYELETLKKSSEMSKVQMEKSGYKAGSNLMEIRSIKVFNERHKEQYAYYQYENLFINIVLDCKVI